MNAVAPRVPHVALLIETSRTYSRALLRGVRRFIAERGPWSVYMELRALDSPVPPWLRHWKGDGVLTRGASAETVEIIRKLGVPSVELRASKLGHNVPFVGVDNRKLGRMVADHLLERGFRRFACYEINIERFFEERRDNFVKTVRAAGYECEVYSAGERSEKPLKWEKQQEELAAWVKKLPRPIGIMACTDQLGFWLLDACQRAGLAVPEEVAVVGVENEEALCTMARPSLSSVAFNGERIGFEAAALLDRMMRGERGRAADVLIEPTGIVTRQSSDVLAIDDPLLIDAVRLIRERACDGINVSDVLRAVPISRTALERRMRSLIGRTPKAEILRVQLAKVKELLANTGLGLNAIADKAGFRHPQYMCEVFKRVFGETPGAFRARNH